MFRNAFNAALRHLMRSRGYAAISVGGLAIGLCAALIAGVVIRNQYPFDHDVPGYDRTYVALWVFAPPGLTPQYGTITMLSLADDLRLRVPEVESAARVLEDRHVVQYDNRSSREIVHWADPDFARTMPLRTIAGDADVSLHSPDGVILMRSTARRFFGTRHPAGRDADDRRSPDDGARDPRRSRRHLPSRRARDHRLRHGVVLDHEPGDGRRDRRRTRAGSGTFVIVSGYTYARLKPGADPARLAEAAGVITNTPTNPVTQFVRIDRLNASRACIPAFAAG